MNNNNYKMARLKAYIEIHECKVPSKSGIRREKPSEVVRFEQSLLNIVFYVAFHSTNIGKNASVAWSLESCTWMTR
jgi:hypothetical protein